LSIKRSLCLQAGTLALDEQRLLFGFNHVYGGAGDDLARTGETILTLTILKVGRFPFAPQAAGNLRWRVTDDAITLGTRPV